MEARFDPSWVSVLDESIQWCINLYNLPGCIFVPRKPHPFGNQYHTIACDETKVVYNFYIVEDKDQPRDMGKKYFEEKGQTSGLVVRITMPLLGKGKVLVVDSGLYVPEGLVSIVEKGVLGSAIIKKRYYWPKGVPEEEILWYMQNNQVGDLDAVQGSMRGKIYHIMDVKEPNYVLLIMTTYRTLQHLQGFDTQRRYKGEGGQLVTKQFNYREVFVNHFNYRHQVDKNNNQHHSHISVESTWA